MMIDQMKLIEVAQVQYRLGLYLGKQPGESLQAAAFMAIRTTRSQLERRLAAHAVLDIGYSIGDLISEDVFLGLRRAIRIYESCGNQ